MTAVTEGYPLFAYHSDMETALHIAAWRRDTELVRKLLARGADADALDHKSRLPLHRVFDDSGGTARGSRDLIGSMLARFTTDLNRADRWDGTPLVLAISRSCFNTARVLVEAGCSTGRTSRGRTPLLAATALRDGDRFVELLLQAGANPNCANELGNTPLHLADTPYSVKLLLEAGAELDAANHDGLTPLGLANKERLKEKVRLLKKAGARRYSFWKKIVPRETESERFLRRLYAKM